MHFLFQQGFPIQEIFVKHQFHVRHVDLKKNGRKEEMNGLEKWLSDKNTLHASERTWVLMTSAPTLFNRKKVGGGHL